MPVYTPQELQGFIPRALLYKLPQIYERKIRPYVFEDGTLLPQTGDLPMGAKTIALELTEQRGQAAIIAGGETDIPLVDVSITEEEYPVVTLAAGFRYTDFELDAWNYASSNTTQLITNIRERRMINMVRAIKEASNRLGGYGDPRYNMTGLLNNPIVPVITSSFTPYHSSVIADDLINWISTAYTQVITGDFLVFCPNVLYVSVPLHTKLITTYRYTAGDANVKKLLLENLGAYGLKDIRPLVELQAGQLEAYGIHPVGTNEERIVFNYLHPTDGFFRKFTPYRNTEPQHLNVEWRVFAYQSVSTVLNEYPTGVLYLDYSNSTS
jgi:hypothetical protein